MNILAFKRRRLALIVPLVLMAPTWACVPPPPVNINPAPPGVEGQLPVTTPVLIQAPPWDPRITPCPGYAMYTDEAWLPAISHEDYQRLFLNQVPLPEAWQATRIYLGGDQAAYQGLAWRAKWWTQGEVPGTSWGAWEVVETGTLLPWSAARTYVTGDKVSYGPWVFMAKWWTTGDTPNTDPYGPWERIPGVQVPQAPLPFQATVYRRVSSGIVQKYDLFLATLTGPQSAAPARWKVHVDGQEILSGSQSHRLSAIARRPVRGRRIACRNMHG
ncbi:carbohydrate-binding protein [Chitinimonas sp. BJYL2]|uniref:carbohydrate-binding protein n=1 Tax=Chitinimonas sp. BJYL2 TaxID=2976696 RepID=UPI0022B56F28|nr:carbohydrate-binding protein [Chitinimonas sp. BJYL2]